MRQLPLLFLLACQGEEPVPVKVDPIDLVTPLGEGEARAGIITQQEARIGGPAGESQLGDVMLKNAVARFVIQGVRDGGGLANQGGSLIDADIVRPAGEPDADLVTDWLVMIDMGHTPRAERVTIVDNGQESGVAVVRVTGNESYLDYLAGALENPASAVDLGLIFETTYTLRADTPLLEVETEVHLRGESGRFEPGDVLMDVGGLGELWAPGHGRVNGAPAETDWLAYVDNNAHVAVGMFAAAQGTSAHPNKGLELVNLLLSVTSFYLPAVEIETGGSTSWKRWWGVAPTVAQLSDAWLDVVKMPTRTAQTTVTAADGPVEGARVTVLVDDAPWTLAQSDEDGRVSVEVPTAGVVRFVADGSGDRIVRDLPAGVADYGPLSGPKAQEASLEAVFAGASGAVVARGRGRAEAAEGEALVLGVPGVLHITAPQPVPFEVRVKVADGSVPTDAFGVAPLDGLATLAYARAGTVDIPIEPGTYDVLVQHGGRWEIHQERVEILAGETFDLQATDLVAAWSKRGWFAADTHVHSAPSSDGKVTLTDRALNMAGVGVDLWFGTEHDVAADAQPLVVAMGLADVLLAVPSVEVSPVVRGHANVFPVVVDPERPNGGAWRWWLDVVTSTTEHFQHIRDTHPDALVQINHPFSPGMPLFAGWSPGKIDRGSLWYGGFDLLEVVKGNREDDAVDLYLDLVARGTLVAPMGNTDSHRLLDNDPGLNVTWTYIEKNSSPVASVAEIDETSLVEALRARRTIASNGPFLDLSILPGTVITRVSSLNVTALSPSWMQVDHLSLLRDGVVVDTVDGDTATFSLNATEDTSFVVIAEGDATMQPLGGHKPFAITSAILLDLGGDGWDPPLPPLVITP